MHLKIEMINIFHRFKNGKFDHSFWESSKRTRMPYITHREWITADTPIFVILGVASRGFTSQRMHTLTTNKPTKHAHYQSDKVEGNTYDATRSRSRVIANKRRTIILGNCATVARDRFATTKAMGLSILIFMCNCVCTGVMTLCLCSSSMRLF